MNRELHTLLGTPRDGESGEPLEMTPAVVSAVKGDGTLGLFINNGDGIANYLSSYTSPAVGDQVLVLFQGSFWVVIGKLVSETT